MILSVSRRTDIPAFFTPWFMNRLHEGYVLVRNPMNYHQVSKVSLSPSLIDCMVFWTKNAAPIISCLEEIGQSYPYYFQYTLNAYSKDIEPYLPELSYRINTFKTLSRFTESKKVIWRYDPVLISDIYTVDWHIEQFSKIAEALSGYTNVCVFSFVDIYDKVKNNLKSTCGRACTENEMKQIAQNFSRIAKQAGISLRTCAETIDLKEYNINHGCCIDSELITSITGWNLAAKKDPNQRQECGCIESIDIGQYNTCRHMCRYCYANFNVKTVETLSSRHNPLSPFLIGEAEPGDKITERKMKSLKNGIAGQLSMY